MSRRNGKVPPKAEDRLIELRQMRDRIEDEIQQVENAIVRAHLARAKAMTAGLQQRRERRRHVAKCGTPSGYYRHRRTLKEPACDECKLAHRVAEQLRVQKRQEEAKTTDDRRPSTPLYRRSLKAPMGRIDGQDTHN